MSETEIEKLIAAVRGSRCAQVWFKFKFPSAAPAEPTETADSMTSLPNQQLPKSVGISPDRERLRLDER